MSKLPRFEAKFWQYGFQWITIVLGNHSPTLVQKFYTVYKGELKRQYLQGNLWRGGDPITSLTVRRVRVNISLLTISWFLNGLSLQPPVNTDDMDYCMDEMQKFTRKQLTSEDKI